MNIPKKAKVMEENKNYIILKLGNHKYSLYDKAEERSIYDATCFNDCYKFLNNIKNTIV